MPRAPRLTIVVLSMSAAALLWAVVVPPYHATVDESVASDSDDASSPGGIVDGLSATPPSAPVIQLAPVLLAFYPAHQPEAPLFILVVRASAPRAPPVLT